MTPSVDFFRASLGLLSAAAGLIHLGAAPGHFGESPLHGSFFVLTGLLQIAAAALLVRTRSMAVLRASAVGNLLIVAIWLMSRTTGLPIDPGRWVPEPVGFADVTCSLIEAFIVAGSLLLLSPEGRRLLDRVRPARGTTTLVAGGCVLFVLIAFSFTAIGSEGHDHAGDRHHTGEAPASHAHAGAESESGAHADGGAGIHGHADAGSDATTPHPTDGRSPDVAHTHDGAAMAPQAHAHTSSGTTAHAHTTTAAADTPRAPHHDGSAAAAPAPTVAAQAMGPSPSDQRNLVRYGPFVLPPASLGGLLHASLIQPALIKPCSNCYITSITPDLVYADGTRANLDSGPMLHHAVWTRPLVPDATCGSGEVLGLVGERFFASGNERTPWVMPTGFGYLVGDDPWALITEIMNHSEELKIVFVELDVTYRPAPDATVKPVKPVWMDVADCRTSEYAIPAGASETRWAWTSTITGRVVATAGHLHDGGTKISLVNETTGRNLCTSAARYGTKPSYAGSLDTMTSCAWDALGIVRSGDVLGLHSYYQSSRAATDVMGIMLVYVHTTSDLEGANLAPDSVTQPGVTAAPPAAHDHH